jgi:vancomycin resistance protein YoaR
VPKLAYLALVLAACSGASGVAEREDRARREAERASAWIAESVRLEAGGQSWTFARVDLGARVIPATTNEALRYDIDRAVLADRLDSLAPSLARPAIPGRIDAATLAITPHVVGAALDVDRSMPHVESALVRGDPVILLAVDEVLPSEGIVPEGLSFAAVVGEYTTRFRRYGSYRGRGRNVETAARSLDGAIIPARGVLSFNERVGPRTRDAGYRMAPVIQDGELVDGMGGGVCQVSSTLFAASFFGGLDIVEHTPHSRPSTYIMAGLDATVVWPDVDLKLENPFDFPLVVRARIEEDQLTIQLLGTERPRTVEIVRRVGRRRAFEERREDDPAIPFGTEEVKQEGIAGRTVFRTRRVTEGARTWEEEAVVTYPPTDRIVLVGVGPPVLEPVAIATP